MPEGWQDIFGDLAVAFHFQPSELNGLTTSELQMWHDQARRLFAKP
ncbi:MAG: GpE family phage tail protein [Rhizobiales bacterium]|nr:GpE family phage tail protein [Hyphomicrobiales bacterium]